MFEVPMIRNIILFVPEEKLRGAGFAELRLHVKNQRLIVRRTSLASLELLKIFEVYLNLSSPDLLQRCLKQHTQNPNESLHSKLWMKCQKVKFSQLPRVAFAASATVLEHNFGSAEGSVVVRMGMVSQETLAGLKKKDTAPPTTPKAKRGRTADDAGPSVAYALGSF